MGHSHFFLHSLTTSPLPVTVTHSHLYPCFLACSLHTYFLSTHQTTAPKCCAWEKEHEGRRRLSGCLETYHNCPTKENGKGRKNARNHKRLEKMLLVVSFLPLAFFLNWSLLFCSSSFFLSPIVRNLWKSQPQAKHLPSPPSHLPPPQHDPRAAQTIATQQHQPLQQQLKMRHNKCNFELWFFDHVTWNFLHPFLALLFFLCFWRHSHSAFLSTCVH